MHIDRFFAPCPRGLEGVLAEELDALLQQVAELDMDAVRAEIAEQEASAS